MLNTKTTTFKKVKKAERFDSKYFFLEDKLKEYQKSSEYTLVPLGDKQILKLITDGEHAGQVFVKEGVLFIKNSSIKEFDISLYDGFYISEKKHKTLTRSALKKEDVLFTTIGHIGSSTVVPEDLGEANINQNLVKMEINSDFVDPYYLSAYLNSLVVKEQIKCLFTGNIHGILTYPKIKSLEVIVPKKSFQLRIRELYRKSIDLENESNHLISYAIGRLKELLNVNFESISKESLYTVTLQETKKIDKWNPNFYYPKYVNTQKEITKNWTVTTLSEIVNISKGNEVGSDNYSSYLDKNDDDIPFIRTSDIYNYQVDLHPDHYVPREIYNELSQDILPGDILYTNDGKIGLTAMLSESDNVIIQSHIRRIRLKPKRNKKYKNITQEYLFALLSSDVIGKFQAKQNTVVQSTIPTLSNRLSDYLIPIIDPEGINEITKLIREAFLKKGQKKELINTIKYEFNQFLN